MVKGLLMLGPMKSARGRDWRRWPVGKGKGVVGLLDARTGAKEALVIRRRLGSGLLGEFWLGSGRLKRGEGCPDSRRLFLGELKVSEATLADEGRWRYPGGRLPLGLLVGGLPRPRMKRPALVAEFGG